MATSKTRAFDLDALLGSDEIETQTIKYRGSEYRLIEPNGFSAIQAFDPDNIHQMAKFVLSFIHPDDRDGFKTALESDSRLTSEKLVDLITALSERVTDTPTG